MKKRLAVLLLTSKKIIPTKTPVIGKQTAARFGDSEAEDYVELLSGVNIPYSIRFCEEISGEDIVNDEYVNYAVIILAAAVKDIPPRIKQVIKNVSYDFGVSVIASYGRIDDQMQEMFGISEVHGKRLCFPCKIEVTGEKWLARNIQKKIALGPGWKINFDRFGLRRHPGRYLKKHCKKIWEQVRFYMKISTVVDADTAAVIKGTSDAAIVRYHYGKAVNYYIALQSDFYLDCYNDMHRIVRQCILENSGTGMAFCDTQETMVLRMDDPGTCERVYLKDYDTHILGQKIWDALRVLCEKLTARVSVMYVPLWVDDAHEERGTLFLCGKEVKQRKKGAVYLSKDVVYRKGNGTANVKDYNYTNEFHALKEGLASGWIDIESHGLTHVDTNREQWANAEDRYTSLDWYHEFRHVYGNRDCRRQEQEDILRKSARLIEAAFGTMPIAVAPSGHEQSRHSEEIAFDTGYKIFSSTYNAFLKNGNIICHNKIQSLFLDQQGPDKLFARAGYPIVGVFHDYDIAHKGMQWLEQKLMGWKQAGIRRFISLRELAGYLCTNITAEQDANTMRIEVDIAQTGDVSNSYKGRYFSSHSMKVNIQVPAEKAVRAVAIDSEYCQDYIYNAQEQRGTVILPAFGSKNKQEITIYLEDVPS